MNKKIIIDEFGIGSAVAIKQGRHLIDLYIDPPSLQHYYPRYSVVIARIIRKVDNLGGYFIKLPNGRQGLLKTKISHQINSYIKVQSKTFFEKNKPQQFLESIKLEEEFVIITRGKGRVYFSKNLKNRLFENKVKRVVQELGIANKNIDLIIRKKAEKVKFTSFISSLNEKIYKFHSLINYKAKIIEFVDFGSRAKEQILNSIVDLNCYEIVEENGSFETNGIWDDIDRFLNDRYEFGNGSYLNIEQTAAFCSIDINSGNNMRLGKGNINLEACPAIMINIRTRGIGGKIIIDFISCSKSFKLQIFNLMKELCEEDYVPTMVWGWTKANNFEIEREYYKTPIDLILDN